MSDEQRLIYMQQLVAITALLQSWYTTPVSILTILFEEPASQNSLFVQMRKEYLRVIKVLWSVAP